MVAPVPIGRPSVGLQPPAVQQAGGLAALGRAEGDLAGETLQPLVRTQEALQTRDVEHQSELAGAQYGGTTAPADIQLPTGNTIGEEAFRKSAVLAAQAQVGLDARANIFDLMDKHPADPQGFQAAADAAMKGYASKLPPDLQEGALKTYGYWADRGFAQVHEQWKSNQVDQSRATIMQEMDGVAAQAANMARAGDYQGALDLSAKLGDYYHQGGPLAEGGSGAFTATQIEQHREQTHDGIAYQYVRGLIDHSKNKTALLKGLEGGSVGDPIADQALGILKPETRDRLIAATRQEIRQDRVDANAAAAQQEMVLSQKRVELGERLRNDLGMREAGMKIDEPPTKSEVMALFPGKHAAAGMKAWDQYQRQAAHSDAVGELKDAPISAILAKANEPVQPGPNFLEDASAKHVYATAGSAVIGQLLEDPGKAVLGSPAVQAAAQAAKADPAAGMKVWVQASLAEQDRREVPKDKQMPFPREEVQAIAGGAATNPDPAAAVAGVVARATLIAGKDDRGQPYGDPVVRANFLKAVEKAGLPGIGAAVEAYDDPSRGPLAATQILSGSHKDEKVDPATTKALEPYVTAAGSSPLVAAGNTLSRITGDDSYAEDTQNRLALAEKLAGQRVRTGVPATQAWAEAQHNVFGETTALHDPHLVVGVPPKGTDAGVAEVGLANLRRNLPTLLPAGDVRHMLDPQGKGGVVTERGAAALVDDWKDTAVWVADPGGFTLRVPIPQPASAAGQLPALYREAVRADGSRVRVTLEQVQAAARGSVAARAPPGPESVGVVEPAPYIGGPAGSDPLAGRRPGDVPVHNPFRDLITNKPDTGDLGGTR